MTVLISSLFIVAVVVAIGVISIEVVAVAREFIDESTQLQNLFNRVEQREVQELQPEVEDDRSTEAANETRNRDTIRRLIDHFEDEADLL